MQQKQNKTTTTTTTTLEVNPRTSKQTYIPLCYIFGQHGATPLSFCSVCLPRMDRGDTSIYQQIKRSIDTKYFIELACSVRVGEYYSHFFFCGFIIVSVIVIGYSSSSS